MPPPTPSPTRRQQHVKPNQLNPAMELAKLQAMYKEEEKKNKVNILLLGESGSGKSFLARTCPGPVHMDFFDPGGATNLRDEILDGYVIPDTRWSDDDPLKPTRFVEWEQTMQARIASGYFNHIGTYYLDSLTTWSAGIMNEILKRAGIPGQAPRFTHDYGPQKAAVQNWIREILRLPCNVIITGHLETIRDETTGRVTRRLMTVGKASIVVPLHFDEIWVMDPKSTSKGVKYQILTQATGNDLARSRLAKDGLLETYEEPNLIQLMHKAKFPIRKPEPFPELESQTDEQTTEQPNQTNED